MIEPYATAAIALHTKMARLGFKLVSDADYAMTFSNGDYSIDIATERNYHPSVLMSLQTIGKQSGSECNIWQAERG